MPDPSSRDRRRRPPLWARILRSLPNRKFAATEAAYRAVTHSGSRSAELAAGNVEFTYRYYVRLLLLLSSRHRRRMQRSTEVVGGSQLLRAIDSGAGTGAVLVSAHLGELEVAATWLTAVAGQEVVAVVDAVSPWWRQLFFDTVRRSCGVQLRRQAEVGIDELADDLAAGRIVLLMADRCSRSATVSASFMGRRSTLPNAAWTLSLRSGAPVLTGTTFRTEEGGCTLRFGDVFGPAECRQLGPEELIQALAADLEREIWGAMNQWHVPADLRQLPFDWESESPRCTAPGRRHSLPQAVAEEGAWGMAAAK